MIKEANVTVIVNDMDGAVRFYTDALGLKLKTRYGNQFAQLEAPGTIIALHPSSRNGPQAGKSESLSIGFSVENLEAAMGELKSKGIKFSSVMDDVTVKLAFFNDPDGNPLYLSESKWS